MSLSRGILALSAGMHDQGLFDNIVPGGVLSANGMASFSQYLEDGETETLRTYIVSLAQAAQ